MQLRKQSEARVHQFGCNRNQASRAARPLRRYRLKSLQEVNFEEEDEEAAGLQQGFNWDSTGRCSVETFIGTGRGFLTGREVKTCTAGASGLSQHRTLAEIPPPCSDSQ